MTETPNSRSSGYTLLLATDANAINATVYDKLNYNFLRDIAPVAGVCRAPLVMVVNPSFRANTVPEFIGYAKVNPGKINMASVGNGTSTHVTGELFKMMTGVNMVHVPYRGGGATLTDLLGGQVQVFFPGVSGYLDHIRAGKLRALAVTSATRLEALPNVPIMADFVPGFEASTWSGLGARKNTPAEIVDKLNKEVNAGPCRPQDEGAAWRLGLHGDCRPARRIREVHGRRNREMGQGGEVFRREAGLIGRHCINSFGKRTPYVWFGSSSTLFGRGPPSMHVRSPRKRAQN
jgi:hypothetical protein